MKPIRPARLLGGSVFAEDRPIHLGTANILRGVDMSTGHPVPVIVREPSEIAPGEPELLSLFARATLTRQTLSGGPVPRLLYTFGQKRQVLASVEEYVGGTRLDEWLKTLTSLGIHMPIEIALAIGRAILPLWVTAESSSPRIQFYADPRALLIEAGGRVRVLPEYAEEWARQVVGAAVGVLRGPVTYIAPEQIMGSPPDPRSSMFTFGLLLYEMLAGSHPVAAGTSTMFDILWQMAKHDLPPLQERRPGLPAEVDAFIRRCVARDPDRRFSCWRELAQAFTAVQALLAPAGPAEVASHLRVVSEGAGPGRGIVSVPAQHGLPPIADPASWGPLPHAGYEAVSLPVSEPGGEARAADTEDVPVLDPDAVYWGVDARPLYRVSTGLLIDARPVTTAEFERFCIATGTRRPAHWGPPAPATENQPCTLLTPQEAESYARWAGKRLPTEAEWMAAVAALGAPRLATGEVWEWTATPHESGGRVVRGGRWRNQAARPPHPGNRSFETGPAVDLGFRCVAVPTEGGRTEGV